MVARRAARPLKNASSMKVMKAKQITKLSIRTKATSALKQLPSAARVRKPPAVWRADYPIIQELRATRDAPVDSVGCERLADPRASRKDFEWQCLVAAMLSSQTKDQQNAEAMAALHKHGNTVESIAKTQ